MGAPNVFGHNGGKGLLGPRPGSLLGQPPLLSLSLNPPVLAPQRQSFPPGYGEDQLSEEQIANFLKTQKTLSQVISFPRCYPKSRYQNLRLECLSDESQGLPPPAATGTFSRSTRAEQRLEGGEQCRERRYLKIGFGWNRKS
jgi:hypothetical protein